MTKYYVFNKDFCFIVLADNPIQSIMKAFDKLDQKITGEYINVSESGTKIRKPDKRLTFQTGEMRILYQKTKDVN